MRKLLCAIFILWTIAACVRMPKNRDPVANEVIYTFDGGKDMLLLFNMKVSYLDSNNAVTTENILSLPWSKKVCFRYQVKASLAVTFESLPDIPEKESYNVGYRGDITYDTRYVESGTNSGKSVLNRSPAGGETCEVLRFNVVFDTPSQAAQAGLLIPYLKYNKHFILTYTVDDAAVGAYSKLWRRVNKKWIDKEEFFHKRSVPSSGAIPAYTLCYTDGCGNERRFPVGAAIWPNARNEWHPEGYMADYSASTYLPYLTWEEVSDILDFGGSVYYHNVDEGRYDPDNYIRIMAGLEEDKEKTYRKTGRYMKTMALPDGNRHYLTAFEKKEDIVMVRAFESEAKIYPDKVTSLYKKRISTGGNGMTKEEILDIIKSQAESAEPYWLSFTEHRPDESSIRFFERLYEDYGKPGKDNIWVATLDEVYEYVTMRNSLRINKTVTDSTAEFEVVVPVKEDYYYKELSFLVKQGGVKGVHAVSGNVSSLSHTYVQGEELININFDGNRLERAGKYTSLYESTLDVADKEDALYFVSLLSPSLAQTYLARIENVYKYPVELTGVVVNEGDNIVYNKIIDLKFFVKNTPARRF